MEYVPYIISFLAAVPLALAAVFSVPYCSFRVSAQNPMLPSEQSIRSALAEADPSQQSAIHDLVADLKRAHSSYGKCEEEYAQVSFIDIVLFQLIIPCGLFFLARYLLGSSVSPFPFLTGYVLSFVVFRFALRYNTFREKDICAPATPPRSMDAHSFIEFWSREFERIDFPVYARVQTWAKMKQNTKDAKSFQVLFLVGAFIAFIVHMF